MRALLFVGLAGGCTAGGGKDSADTGSDEAPFAELLISGGTNYGTFGGFVMPAFWPASAVSATTPTAEAPALDTCTFSGPTTTTTTTTTPTLETLDGGVVTIELDGAPVTLGPYGFATLTEWPAGASVSFAATGGEVPDFDAPDFMTLPDALDPVTITENPDGSRAVTWSGASDELVWVILADAETGSQLCFVVDDGAFEVPDAGLVDPIVSIARTRYGMAIAPDVHVGGLASYISTL